MPSAEAADKCGLLRLIPLPSKRRADFVVSSFCTCGGAVVVVVERRDADAAAFEAHAFCGSCHTKTPVHTAQSEADRRTRELALYVPLDRSVIWCWDCGAERSDRPPLSCEVCGKRKRPCLKSQKEIDAVDVQKTKGKKR